MQQRVDMMYVHALDPLKGWFNLCALDKSAPIDSTYLANGVVIPPGRCVFLNDAGNFTADRKSTTSYPGGAITNYKTAMPMFLWAGTSDADVYNDGTALTQTTLGTATTNWIAVQPSGVSMALVATGGYELQTTEYDSTVGVPAYLPNTPLYAITNAHANRGTTLGTAGGLFTAIYPNCGIISSANDAGGGATPPAPFTDHIVGIASAFVQGQVNYLQPTNLANPVSGNAALGYNAHGMEVLSFWPYFLPST